MSLTYAKEIKQNVEFVQNFTGYNHNLRCGQGQFYDMANMTGDYAPVLSTRSLRSQLLAIVNEPQALFAKDYVYYISGRNIVWGEVVGTTWVQRGIMENVLDSEFENTKRQVADIASLVFILPDKKILDVKNHTIKDAGFFYEDHSWTRIIDNVEYTTTGQLKFTPSTLEGEPIEYEASATEPEDTSVYWLNTDTKAVFRYNAGLGMWQQLDNVYLKVEPVLNYEGGGAGTDATTWLNAIKDTINGLTDYDTVNLTLKPNGDVPSYDTAYGKLGGDTVIFHVGDGFFTIVGIQPEMFQTDFEFTLRFPDMAYITSLNNRIWGCSSDGTEVYCCKLGDPSQWYNYADLSSDSYAATIGSDGRFTGAIAYNNNVLFFKKDRLHKVMGNYPSNFQVAEYTVNGVAEGCEKSLCVVNGYLFYMGEENVMIYDGSLPRSCSEEFGDMKFISGVAGQQMNKYYLSTNDGTTIRQFVYDTEKQQWWKEDDTEMEETCTHFNNLYSVHHVQDEFGVWQHILTKEVGSYEGEMDWFVETGDLGLDTPYQKYTSKVQFRMAFTGTMYVEIEYDGGEFTRVFTKTTENLRSFTVPINVKRCDHFRIRIGGRGVCKIYSIGYNIETGSEIC